MAKEVHWKWKRIQDNIKQRSRRRKYSRQRLLTAYVAHEVKRLRRDISSIKNAIDYKDHSIGLGLSAIFGKKEEGET